MQNYCFAINCIHQYLNDLVIKNTLKIKNWQGCIIQLAFPYKEGKIEGGLFVYEWLARILNIEIHLRYFETRKVTTKIPYCNEGTQILNIVEVQTNEKHKFYKPLKNLQ